MGCSRLIINFDNIEVINTMKNEGHPVGAAATVFDDCYFLACDFPLIRFGHCNREANKMAQELASIEKSTVTKDCFEEPLDEIVKKNLDDVTVISN
uniref:RNase H type-1 domain-containing protein n=1 Tax=Hordeum vulgare subsp. vulgare TaxID=112509 RepID=A0A8I6X6U4_HORVV